MANEELHMSAAGMASLRRREGAVLRYYNDLANNCTFGVGTLVHPGRCTDEELRRPVTVEQVDRELSNRVQAAEGTVRESASGHQLTQAEFDSLVSFVYNTGARGAAATLDAANRGERAEVVRHMNNTVYVHPRDARGRRLAPVRVQGLVNRRREEAAPFEQRPNGR